MMSRARPISHDRSMPCHTCSMPAPEQVSPRAGQQAPCQAPWQCSRSLPAAWLELRRRRNVPRHGSAQDELSHASKCNLKQCSKQREFAVVTYLKHACPVRERVSWLVAHCLGSVLYRSSQRGWRHGCSRLLQRRDEQRHASACIGR
jgi:hypothetical protein